MVAGVGGTRWVFHLRVKCTRVVYHHRTLIKTSFLPYRSVFYLQRQPQSSARRKGDSYANPIVWRLKGGNRSNDVKLGRLVEETVVGFWSEGDGCSGSLSASCYPAPQNTSALISQHPR